MAVTYVLLIWIPKHNLNCFKWSQIFLIFRSWIEFPHLSLHIYTDILMCFFYLNPCPAATVVQREKYWAGKKNMWNLELALQELICDFGHILALFL